MNITRLFRRPRLARTVILVAALALMVQVLAPALALAGSGGTRVPVCTAAGIVWQVVDAGGGAPASGEHDPAAHCPFCLPQQALALPPPPAAAVLPRDFVTGTIAVVVSQIVVPSPRGFAHASRAPPAFA